MHDNIITVVNETTDKFAEMNRIARPNDAVHFYMSELTHRLVAESGRPSDRFHLGKLILQGLKAEPDLILQIDGATGERESSASVLRRSVRCARALRARGLRRGDVMVFMAPSYLDLCIPYYAALYLGLAIAPVDWKLTIVELQHFFSINRPKVIFCESNKVADVQKVLETLKLDADILAFDQTDDKISSFQQFLQIHGTDEPVDNFKAEDFDPEDTIAFLVPTSGTTGLSKLIACCHKSIVISGAHYFTVFNNFPRPTNIALILSPLQWMSAIIAINFTPILRMTRLQTSKEITKQHSYDLINAYKPTFTLLSPTFMTMLTNNGETCDFTSFRCFYLGGSAVSVELIEKLKVLAPDATVLNVYGMSELSGFLLDPTSDVIGSSGKPSGHLQYRLVDTDTGKDIVEANVKGELWVKGPAVMKGYYRNDEATKDTINEDGWLKTGDLLYRDDYWNFFFVERYKLLLKYRNHHISPSEIEEVIRGHPAVEEVAVGGIPDPECGELPVACVVRRQGSAVTSQEIKDLVKGTLTDTKQLRGGVIFLEQLPLTPTGKINRTRVKELILNMARE